MSHEAGRTGGQGALFALGRGGLRVGDTVAGALRLLRESARAVSSLEPAEVSRQTYALANRSAFFVTVVMGFVGAIMTIQACVQAERLIGDTAGIGPAFMQLVIREFGPTIVALMVAARYGAGVAAELGAMTITEQVDALRMAGAEPPGYLVLPRLVAGLLGMVPLAVLGVGVAFLAGGVAARYGFGVPWEVFRSTRFVDPGDVAVGTAKALSYGVAVPLCAAHAGLLARGGAPGVGRATTLAVIHGSIAVLFLDLVVGTIAYLIETRL